MKQEIILLDVETQADFFLPGGSMYTQEAMNVRSQVYRLFEWASKNHHSIISTVLRSGISICARIAASVGSPGEGDSCINDHEVLPASDLLELSSAPCSYKMALSVPGFTATFSATGSATG